MHFRCNPFPKHCRWFRVHRLNWAWGYSLRPSLRPALSSVENQSHLEPKLQGYLARPFAASPLAKPKTKTNGASSREQYFSAELNECLPHRQTDRQTDTSYSQEALRNDSPPRQLKFTPNLHKTSSTVWYFHLRGLSGATHKAQTYTTRAS